MDLADSSLTMEARSAEDSSVPTLRNVCIGYSILSNEYDEGLVVLDLNSGNCSVVGSTHLVPRVKFVGNFFPHSAYCVVGNTIYVFEGYIYTRCLDDRPPREKSVYSYVLPMEGSGYKVDKDMLKKVCDMESIKYRPNVIPTPDGKKFVVYGSRPAGDCGHCNVDLFDPSTKACEKLPTLYPINGSMLSCTVISHTFVTDSELVLLTEGGWCRLDLKAPKQDWERLSDFIPYVPFKNGEFQLIRGICFTIDSAYDIHVEKKYRELASMWSFTYPEPTPLPDVDGMLKGDRHLFLLDIKDYKGHDINDPRDFNCQSCTFCIIQFGCVPIGRDKYKDQLYIAHLVGDIYSCDVGECKKKLRNYRKDMITALKKKKLQLETRVLPGTSIIKSFMYQLDAQYSEEIDIRAFSSVVPASISSVLAVQHLD